MGILFKDVYTKAIALFDDPKITTAYKTNTIQFEKIMYTYLQNAVGSFQNPLSVGMRLSKQNLPFGSLSVFESDGNNKKFILDESININFEPFDKCYEFNFIENNKMVIGQFIKETREIIFPDVLPIGQEYGFEIYYCGEFLDDFSDLNSNTNKGDQIFLEQIKNILAKLLVRNWAEEERNFVLDIRNLMQDTDFKLMSNDRILKSKNEWVKELDDDLFLIQNRLAWSIRFANSASKIGRG